MQRRAWWTHSTFRFIGIAASYCAALVLFRQLSIPHWIILTGFHLAVLMVMDYKDWPALFVGEVLRLGYVSVMCYDQYGMSWALVNLIPSLTYEAPVVWAFRERLQLFPSRNTVNVPALVLCSLLVASIATVITIGQLQLTPLPPGYVLHYGEVVARLVLGNFVGVLTVAPITLVAHQSMLAAREKGDPWWHEVFDSRLFLECIFVVVPLIIFLGWVGLNDAHARAVAQMAMFLPVVILAIRHGWKGAAAGGTLASLGVVMLMPAQNDHATLQAETLVAMAITTMLLVGARIAVLDRRAQQEHDDVRLVLALAQRNVLLGEAQHRASAMALEQVRDSFQRVFNLTLSRLGNLQPTVDEAGYRRQALHMHNQLSLVTEGLHPAMLRERGLPGALAQGPLAEMLHDAGIRYDCDLRGPLSLFTYAVNLAVYRIVVEAIADACNGQDVCGVRVKIRCGEGERSWMVIVIDTQRDAVTADLIEWRTLQSRLRLYVSGLGRQAIEDRAATFEGRVRERVFLRSTRLVVSLLQPNHPHD